MKAFIPQSMQKEAFYFYIPFVRQKDKHNDKQKEPMFPFDIARQFPPLHFKYSKSILT